MSRRVMAPLRTLRSDALLSTSAQVLTTTMMMAGAGAAFWVIVARLASPVAVGLAGSLAATGDALAMFAQLGLNIAIIRSLQQSERKAVDVTAAAVAVTLVGAALALVYVLVLPVTSPSLVHVVRSPGAIALYCVLVGATALNVLTDSVFLAVDRVIDYLKYNGIVLGAAKCGLPFVLAGAGALGVYSSIGLAVLLCAVLSMVALYRSLPGPRLGAPSRFLLHGRRFAGAAYVTYVLSVLPVFVNPLIVLNAEGASKAGAYFISYQVITLLSAILLALTNSTYAQCERAQTGRRALVRQGGRLLLGAAVLGAAVTIVAAPYVLRVFGPHYVADGTSTLRVFALSALGAAVYYRNAIALRLSGNLRAMMGVQFLATAVMLVVATAMASRGPEWVAASFGIGHLAGAALGGVAGRSWARFDDAAPAGPPLNPAVATS